MPDFAFPVITPNNTPLNVAGENAYSFYESWNAGAAANTILATSGALTAGDYEIKAHLTSNTSGAGKFAALVIRNATNTANTAIMARENGYFASAKAMHHFERVTIGEGESICWQTGNESWSDYVSTHIAIRKVA